MNKQEEIVKKAVNKRENELYLITEFSYAKGMTFEKFLRAWATKLTKELIKE